MPDNDLIRRGDAFAACRPMNGSNALDEAAATIAALPAVTVGMEQLRAAFDAGCENGWDHARWESVYDPQPLGCEDAFNKFLAALPAVTVGVPCTWPSCGHTAKGQCQGTGVHILAALDLTPIDNTNR